jgi:hypothetical protein
MAPVKSGYLEFAIVQFSTDIVRIRHTTAYDNTTDDADVIGIDTDGVLRFSIAQSTRLHIGTLIVSQNGTLEIATSSTPI